MLTGKYLPGQPPPAGIRGATDAGRRRRFIARYLTDDVLHPGAAAASRSPTSSGCRMAQLAVAWVLQNQNVAAAIIGASRPEQVRDNVKAAGVELSADVLTRIDEVLGDVVERDPAKTSRG